MDLKQTGEFIAKCRKEKGLTQEKLAEKLFVSEKAVSKWECGKGFPDTALIVPLCEILGVTANELLTGNKLTTENYKTAAENNLVELKDSQVKSAKHLLVLEWVIGIIATVFLFLSVFSASYFVENLAWRVVLICAGVVVLFVAIGFCLHIERNAGFYECGHCHHKYIPTYGAVIWSMHVGRTRYMKCPKCGKRSWSKKTVK